MAEAIRMPLLSDTMKEGVIAAWHKKVGDKVKSDDVLADVETDKATMEVMPYVDGTLLYLGVKEGQGVPVNGIIAIVGKEGEDYQSILDAEKGQGGGNGGHRGGAPCRLRLGLEEERTWRKWTAQPRKPETSGQQRESRSRS